MALPKNHTNKKPHSALKTKQNKKTKIKKTKKNYVCRYDQRSLWNFSSPTVFFPMRNNIPNKFHPRSVVAMDTKWHFLWKIFPREAFELQPFGFHNLELTALNAKAWTDFILTPSFCRSGNWGSSLHFLLYTSADFDDVGHYIFTSLR